MWFGKKNFIKKKFFYNKLFIFTFSNFNLLLIILIKKFYFIYVNNNTFFLIINLLNVFKLYIIKNLYMLIVKYSYYNNFYKIWRNSILSILIILQAFFFKKIKFTGKGYYLFLNKKNFFNSQFGYSHKFYIHNFYSNVFIFKKKYIYIYSKNLLNLLLISKTIKLIRTINIFTNRGIRFNKQIIYKKTGKVSQYR